MKSQYKNGITGPTGPYPTIAVQTKPLNPNARENDGDPVLKEGNLLSNVLNRAVRSCFYTAQKFSGGKIPVGEITPEILEQANH